MGRWAWQFTCGPNPVADPGLPGLTACSFGANQPRDTLDSFTRAPCGPHPRELIIKNLEESVGNAGVEEDLPVVHIPDVEEVCGIGGPTARSKSSASLGDHHGERDSAVKGTQWIPLFSTSVDLRALARRHHHFGRRLVTPRDPG